MTTYEDYAYDEYLISLAEEEQYEQWRKEVIAGLADDIDSEFIRLRMRQAILNKRDQIKRAFDILNETKEAIKHQQGSASVALVSTCTALEIIINCILIHPCLEGVVVYETLSSVLIKRWSVLRRFQESIQIVSPIIEYALGVNIETLIPAESDQKWPVEYVGFREIRNAIVHRGEVATVLQAEAVLSLADRLVENGLAKVLKALELTIAEGHQVTDLG